MSSEGAGFRGRRVVVTGGAQGIGYALARALAEAGAAVLVADQTGAESAAFRMREKGLDVAGVTVDVTSTPDAERMVATAIEVLGGLDVLVNNAGLFATIPARPFEEVDDEEWLRVLDVNVLGVLRCCRAAIDALRRSPAGSIVNLASTTAFRGAPGRLHYAASKGAVVSMTRGLAREVGRDGITVNAIAPGFTISDGTLAAPDAWAEAREASRRGRALARDQQVGDLVGAVLYLAGPGARFVTGQCLVVDGGSTMH